MKNIKRIVYLCVAMALVCALGLSLAYFTDRVDGNGSISTNENALDIEVVPPTENPDPTDDEIRAIAEGCGVQIR